MISICLLLSDLNLSIVFPRPFFTSDNKYQTSTSTFSRYLGLISDFLSWSHRIRDSQESCLTWTKRIKAQDSSYLWNTGRTMAYMDLSQQVLLWVSDFTHSIYFHPTVLLLAIRYTIFQTKNSVMSPPRSVPPTSKLHHLFRNMKNMNEFLAQTNEINFIALVMVAVCTLYAEHSNRQLTHMR